MHFSLFCEYKVAQANLKIFGAYVFCKCYVVISEISQKQKEHATL